MVSPGLGLDVFVFLFFFFFFFFFFFKNSAKTLYYKKIHSSIKQQLDSLQRTTKPQKQFQKKNIHSYCKFQIHFHQSNYPLENTYINSYNCTSDCLFSHILGRLSGQTTQRVVSRT
eukprot:TRINITY_DN5594_c1_g1_i1.p5 TRINITY_DN5594_c1_g1~~TRINITY_DN5594_c1_g1_i1.p5  ORF type:complete len:116 (-),score=1.04 TRINITY_DN5594_c1_g1_i1:627-974(-)